MNLLLFLGLTGPTEIILVFLAILLLFGGRKIPELMRGLGRGIREFNDARSKVTTEIKEGMKEDPNANQNTAKREEIEMPSVKKEETR